MGKKAANITRSERERLRKAGRRLEAYIDNLPNVNRWFCSVSAQENNKTLVAYPTEHFNVERPDIDFPSVWEEYNVVVVNPTPKDFIDLIFELYCSPFVNWSPSLSELNQHSFLT